MRRTVVPLGIFWLMLALTATARAQQNYGSGVAAPSTIPGRGNSAAVVPQVQPAPNTPLPSQRRAQQAGTTGAGGYPTGSTGTYGSGSYGTWGDNPGYGAGTGSGYGSGSAGSGGYSTGSSTTSGSSGSGSSGTSTTGSTGRASSSTSSTGRTGMSTTGTSTTGGASASGSPFGNYDPNAGGRAGQ